MSTTKLHNHRQFTKYFDSIGLLWMNNLSRALKSFFIGLNILVFYAHIFLVRNNSFVSMLQSIFYCKCWLQKLENNIYGFIFFLSYSYNITLARYE